MALSSGEVYGQTGGCRRRRRGQEGPGEGQDLEPSVESDDGAGRSRLPQGDVGDRSGAAHDANPSLATAGEGGDAIDDVAAVGDFHDVRFEGVGAVTRDDDGRLGLVLGSGGSSARSS